MGLSKPLDTQQIFSFFAANSSYQRQNASCVSLVLHTLNFLPTCYWRRYKQIVTDAAVQFHRPSIDAWNSRHSICAWFSWSPSGSSQPWNIQSTNIRICLIASFISFEWRLWVHNVFKRLGENDEKTTFLPECIFERKLLYWRDWIVILNKRRRTTTYCKSHHPNYVWKICFAFILTKAHILRYEVNYQ